MASKSRAVSAVDGWRAYAVSVQESYSEYENEPKTAAGLGFNVLLALGGSASDPAWIGRDAALSAFAAAAHKNGLRASAAIVLDRIASSHDLAVKAGPGVFWPGADAATGVVDPRKPIAAHQGDLLLRKPRAAELIAWWTEQLDRLAALAIDDFVQIDPAPAGRRLAETLARTGPGGRVRSLSGTHDRNAGDAQFVQASAVFDSDALKHSLAEAALRSGAWAFADAAHSDRAGIPEALRSVNRLLACDPPGGALVRDWDGPGADLQLLSRAAAGGGLVLARNRSGGAIPWPPADLPPMPWRSFAPVSGFEPAGSVIAPGQTLLLEASSLAPAKSHVIDHEPALDPGRRVVISSIAPSVDGGAFAIKRVIGERIEVRADIFSDGHEKLAATVLARPVDEVGWTRYPMIEQPNDVWTASFSFDRLGPHEFVVEAWFDIWGGFTRDLEKKQRAGRDLTLELREGRAFIDAALARASETAPSDIAWAARELARTDLADPVTVLLSAALASAMSSADPQPFLTRSFIQPVEVEREAARFSSWYEIFPRSQTDDGARHGTFADVTARMPHVAAMGFDTLYFPPIHPIGSANRKGRNNTLTPGPDDVGSPYAIGAPAGGHDAIHSELGTLDDFRGLVAAAKRHGLEIALDFAIQCSPDHPWLREHPNWFAWRADGSLKYAENPPKTYEDIVNVDFYAPEGAPDLWRALRDVVLFWLAEGVKTFRVDNPHTKPLPFWRWLIAEVKAVDPEAIFLSEAFTRPKPMYHLAKVGFSQSYTYFTWRHGKAELQDYLTELTQTPVREFFRPHFFVNTPDINPHFLQTSGRGGFLIRAALAATLSGLFGVYAGFELCESAALPGREEYLDSEKYEIRPRPDRAPGDIVDEITQLNQLRRAEPALQNHLGVSFHNAFNDQILYFSKSAPGRRDLILVAVSLDPYGVQDADFEVPLWLFGLSDWEAVEVEDLLSGRRFRWTGKMQRVRLTPAAPYAIWRITPVKGG